MSPDGAGVVLSVTVIGTADAAASASRRSSARPASSPPAETVLRASTSALASRSSTAGFTSGAVVAALGAGAAPGPQAVANTTERSSRRSRRTFDLDAREHEGTDTMVVVRRDGTLRVVLERAVAVGRAAEPRPHAAAGDVDGSVGPRVDEPLDDRVVRPQRQTPVL